MVLTFPPTGVAPGFTGDAAGDADGEATGLAAGLAVEIGDGVVVAGLFGVVLLPVPLLQAPSAAVAARTELIMNDLLIVFLLRLLWAN